MMGWNTHDLLLGSMKFHQLWNLPSGELTFCHGKIHHAINGKIHYFDWAIFHCYVSSPVFSREMPCCILKKLGAAQVMTPIRLLNYAVVGWSVVPCQPCHKLGRSWPWQIPGDFNGGFMAKLRSIAGWWWLEPWNFIYLYDFPKRIGKIIIPTDEVIWATKKTSMYCLCKGVVLHHFREREMGRERSRK